ncbi:MAG TPA: hypothetical protein PLL17_08805 [Defluviitaleaceae bacterium]|nr:hypothetical protein [Defluviitaleaceae bacterium]
MSSVIGATSTVSFTLTVSRQSFFENNIIIIAIEINKKPINLKPLVLFLNITRSIMPMTVKNNHYKQKAN